MREAPTRERLITEAMRLFGEQGYQATSVAQIEAAAGLAPGSGALYHHFKSKEALLEAGIDRQLDRRHAMRDIRALFAGLGDLRSELTMLGRYVLTVLDE
ncbi:helix-turn-helix domain-containing protein, partial [Mycobacterium sp.]|uniref:helix-turn-helix domain-containing protein n=1 Tax=Mycobacterium sp. TaxID=1785 RepID=UPI002DB4D33F|nr:helix-turn-helix domain-containing protein [Mycobacterium sp.]